ncbi:MAG TPA: Uma2 family endonuclease [Acetobacteraceae bacterium]|nr:Uma2 family endonuclease [Acetobacteraceae bacterium]
MSQALRYPPPPSRMTVDEFLVWDSGDHSGRRWQLVDGEPAAMAPASENHGAIQSELARLIGNHLIEHRPGCRVITEPGVIPRLRAGENWRIPDLGVTCAPPAGGVEMAEPVLLVEILSPNNYAETRANLWTYTTLPSVAEILVVNVARIEAELLRRGADGTWPEQPVILRDGDMLTLASIGLSLPLRAVYRTTSLLA